MPISNGHHQTVWSRCRQFLLLLFVLSSLIFALTLHTANAAQVTLAWNQNAEENVVGYNVYYGTSSENYDWVLDVGNATSITITDLSVGLTYYFAVTAYDDSSPSLESTYSNEVSKSTCTYSISSTSSSFTASGGTGSVSVTTQTGCTWTASSSASWLIITSGGSGTGSGTINYSVSANTSPDARTASSTFAGKVFTVSQPSATTYTITASAGTGGTISPSSTVTVAQGANQAFTIAASTGYQVSDVTVDGTSIGEVSSYTFSNVTANHSIAATFSVKTYTINASSGTGGTITPNGSVSVNHGSSQSFAIAASTGYQISNVIVDGTSVGAVSSYAFSNVTANHTIAATFSIKTYTITASAGTGGSISPSGSVSVAYGSSRTFSITTNTGYTLADVLVDGVSVGAVSSYTFNNVTAAHTISASFSVTAYTIAASAGTGGSISPSGSVSVNHGAGNTFTISPDTGYGVANVLVDGASVGALGSYTFNNVTGNHTISASFAANTYTITAAAGTGGTISPSGLISVNGGTNQTFSITTNTGYRIVDVLVDGSSVGALNTYTFANITSSHTISVSFVANTYTIISSAGVGGTISPTGSVSVNHGSNQSFTMSASIGYQISNVTVDGTSVGAVSSYTFSNVTANHTIAATFSVKTYSITASAGTGGSISPSGSTSLNHGANQTFTITPNTGHSIANITVDGVSQGAISSYTFSNVTANHTISASFAVNTFTINASAGTGGTISPSGNVTVPYGGSQTLTIKPASGYAISTVLVDGISQGSVGVYAFSNVSANHTISVTFSQITFTINASVGTGGSISPAGSVNVAQGANQTFAFTADSGYVVSDVLVDGSSMGAVGSYTFTNVTSSHTIIINFAPGFTLTLTTSGTGSGKIDSNPVKAAYAPGTKVNLRATKDYNSTFEGFSGDCTTRRSSCTVIMNKNSAVNGMFKLKTFKVSTTAIGDGTISVEENLSTTVDTQKTYYKVRNVAKAKRSKHETKVDYGDQLLYNITPEAGNYVKRVVVDGKSQGSVNALTFYDVKRNHTVKVRFASETQLSKNTQFETRKHQIFFRDEEERDGLQTLTDDLAENNDSKSIIESSSTDYYASVKSR
jgi:hypothetical protein